MERGSAPRYNKCPVANETPEPKRKKDPAWWKNTYFWIGGFLFVVGVIGLIKGPAVIRDPGQKREDDIVVWLYFVGAVIMVVNGWLSHRLSMQTFREEQGLE